ncbi:MAG TPA: hypothetical protein VK421_15920 [Pyrinomonadaceae bacterium]|nr:hypothetical protein [Pyrinomonadaceae bacterium]
MLETRLDTMDFRPDFPLFRLLFFCAGYGMLCLGFALETRNVFTYNSPVAAGTIVERVLIGAMLLSVFVSLALWLLLPFRLRYTEAGILRRTVFRPRFIPWQSVTAASLTSFKGSVWLELRATGRRLPVLIPLIEYRRAASLLAQIRRRLPVDVQDPGGQLAARLSDG